MQHWVRGIKTATTDNSAVILTVLGSCGVVLVAVSAVRDGVRAERRLEIEQPETFPEKVKCVWTEYIPTATVAAVTVSCIVGANTIQAKRVAAITSAYSLTENALREYREQVKTTLGEKKEHAVLDSLAQSKVSKIDSSIMLIEDSKVLCLDSYTGRYFQSSMETIRRAVNDINKRILDDDYASLNDFYGHLDIDSTGGGDSLGWDTDALCELYFSSVLTADGKPCLSFGFENPPKLNYWKR